MAGALRPRAGSPPTQARPSWWCPVHRMRRPWCCCTGQARTLRRGSVTSPVGKEFPHLRRGPGRRTRPQRADAAAPGHRRTCPVARPGARRTGYHHVRNCRHVARRMERAGLRDPATRTRDTSGSPLPGRHRPPDASAHPAGDGDAAVRTVGPTARRRTGHGPERARSRPGARRRGTHVRRVPAPDGETPGISGRCAGYRDRPVLVVVGARDVMFDSGETATAHGAISPTRTCTFSPMPVTRSSGRPIGSSPS